MLKLMFAFYLSWGDGEHRGMGLNAIAYFDLLKEKIDLSLKYTAYTTISCPLSPFKTPFRGCS